MVFNIKESMLHIKTAYPHAIRVIENTWIPMADGSVDAENFHITNALEAYEGHTRVFAKTWSCSIARDGV